MPNRRAKPGRRTAAPAKPRKPSRREQALERFRQANPQLWLQSQRVGRIIEIQQEIDGKAFPEGSCFVHANSVAASSFCLKRIQEVNLDTCQVTLEIYGDDNLESGIVVLPLESIEWFGFPSKAVPVEIHFRGFTGLDRYEGPTFDHITQALAPTGVASPKKPPRA
jgi:hypothetical protein